MNSAELRAYLHMIVNLRERNTSTKRDGWRWSCVEDLVLKEGKLFSKRAVNVERGPRHECYKNALHLAVASNGALFYCEGWATSVVPVQHAWCVDRAGNVYDPTWEERSGDLYLGLVFEADEALRVVLEKRVYGVLFDYVGRPNEQLLAGNVALVGDEVHA